MAVTISKVYIMLTNYVYYTFYWARKRTSVLVFLLVSISQSSRYYSLLGLVLVAMIVTKLITWSIHFIP